MVKQTCGSLFWNCYLAVDVYFRLKNKSLFLQRKCMNIVSMKIVRKLFDHQGFKRYAMMYNQ